MRDTDLHEVGSKKKRRVVIKAGKKIPKGRKLI